jgi:hypothetical protein
MGNGIIYSEGYNSNNSNNNNNNNNNNRSLIFQQLEKEAKKPSDLSDFGSTPTLLNTRAEVTRLRTLLRIYTDVESPKIEQVPPTRINLQRMELPIPTKDELQYILDSQIASKKVMEARKKRIKKG